MEKVLVIDDDKPTRMVLEHILSWAGYKMLEAVDGQAGIEAFHSHRPLLVIIDMIMPVKGGEAVIREIKHLSPTQNILAIAGGGDPVLKLALQAGATFVMTKPFSMYELLEVVHYCISNPFHTIQR